MILLVDLPELQYYMHVPLKIDVVWIVSLII